MPSGGVSADVVMVGTSVVHEDGKKQRIDDDDIEKQQWEGGSLPVHFKESDTTETESSAHSSSSRCSSHTSLSETPHDDIVVVVSNEIGAPNSSSSSSSGASLASLCRCPLTHELFQDPVVSPDGETYERRAYVEQHGEDGTEMSLLYPNRALQAIMEDDDDDDDVLWQRDSFHGNWRRLQDKAQKVVTGYFLNPSSSSSSLAEDDEAAVPPRRPDVMAVPLSHGFFCPVTCNIMHDPVIDPDGTTFERVVVENWIRCHGTSPLTRRKLTVHDLRPNRLLQRLLEEETKRPAESMRPEILKWMTEAAPKPSDVEYGGMMSAADTRAEDRRLSHRGQDARRQVVYNMVGIFICILLLKCLHYSVL